MSEIPFITLSVNLSPVDEAVYWKYSDLDDTDG